MQSGIDVRELLDADCAIDAAFNELECVSRVPRVPHDGEVAAWVEYHDCYQGWICRGHLDHWLTVTVPSNRRIAEGAGVYKCRLCHRAFSEDGLAKVYPL